MAKAAVVLEQTTSSGTKAFRIDRDAIRQAYEQKRPSFDALKEEAIFILSSAIQDAHIKIHDTVDGRVKDFDSFFSKAVRKRLATPIDDIHDIVGVRIICLFRSDLQRLDDILHASFDIISTDDKIQAASDSFGYMSIHYICRMKAEYAGPRYEKIKNLEFEIQLRTLCMHAWAAVSHYLDYKRDLEVPRELKKDLNALSGLFYVADTQFEAVYQASTRSRRDAFEQLSSEIDVSTELNLDTLLAYFAERFPARRVYDADAAVLLSQIKYLGFGSIQELDKAVQEGLPAVERQDKASAKQAKQKVFYSANGMVRLALVEKFPEHEAYLTQDPGS